MYSIYIYDAHDASAWCKFISAAIAQVDHMRGGFNQFGEVRD